eukprot:s2080_g4.t1
MRASGSEETLAAKHDDLHAVCMHVAPSTEYVDTEVLCGLSNSFRRAAGAVHFVLILTGSLVLIQSFHTLNFFHEQGQWASLRDMARTCWQSYLLVLKFFMAPFFEARFLDGWLTSQVDFDTWAVFVPGTGTLEIVFFIW